MRQPSIRVLASALLLAAVTAGQDTSPPCIRSCYDNNPGPQRCGGVEEMTAGALATCTCSSFYGNQDHPLLLCIRECPESEKRTYLAGFKYETEADCEHLFHAASVPSGTTTGATSNPTNSPDANGDDQGAGTSGVEDPAEPNGASEAFNRAASTVLAVGGLVVALLF
jgi:hypothetical protein